MFWASRDAEADAAPFLITEDGAQHSYASIFEQADTLFRGCARGVVLILCRRDIDTVLGYVGALRAGLVPLMLDAEMRTTALDRILTTYAPEYIFADAETAERLGASLCASATSRGVYRLADGSERAALHPDLALLLPTSGSTGDPKCVRLSADNIQSCAEEVVDYLGMTADRRAITLLPFQYSYGLSVLHVVAEARASLLVTELTVLNREIWSVMEDAKITDFAGVPFIFETLRRMRLPEGVLNNLRCVTQAGGRLAPEITQRFAEMFAAAGVSYFTMYGQTEAAPRIAYLPPERALDKLGSVGVPLACGTVELGDPSDETGEGELIYKGPNVCLGYANSRGDLSAGDDMNGVLHTGDQARIDADGYIYIVGRRKRFVKVHGLSVNLDHFEAVLSSEAGACMVVGKDNRIVICHLDGQDAALKKAVSQNFAFHPSTLRYQTVDVLPRNASGKADYVTLSESYL